MGFANGGHTLDPSKLGDFTDNMLKSAKDKNNLADTDILDRGINDVSSWYGYRKGDTIIFMYFKMLDGKVFSIYIATLEKDFHNDLVSQFGLINNTLVSVGK